MEINPKCQRCPLHESAVKVCIPSRGHDRPRLLFVGQAPGAEEDIAGECFVGPPGRVLVKAIKDHNLRPCRLTNLAKCFPPKDRKPKKVEIQKCIPYLNEEIKKYKPEYIVALGGVVLQALTGKSGINNHSGRIVGDYDGVPVFCLMHPSAVLHKPSNRTKFEAGCKELEWLLRPAARPRHPAVQELSPSDAWDWFVDRNQEHPLAIDYETTKKTPMEGGTLRCFSLSDGREAVWVAVEKQQKEAMEVLGKILQSDREKIAHGLSFEFMWSKHLFGREPKGFKHDTMLYHYLTDENSSHALNSIVLEEFGVPDWDIYPQMVDEGWGYDNFPMERLGPYNALDSYWTARLYALLKDRMTEPLRGVYKKIVLPMAKVCARLQDRGIKVDQEWAQKATEVYDRDMAAAESAIMSLPVVHKFKAKVEAEKRKFNLGSPKQMGRLLYKEMKLPVLERTKGGDPATGTDTLERLRKYKPDVIGAFLEWKGLRKSRDSYLVKFPKFCDDQGLIHPSYNNSFVVTGRLSVTDPPAQTLTDDKLVRGMLVSRFEGGKLLSSDYKQLEILLVASEAGEEKMLQAHRDKKSLHDLTAEGLFGKDFTPEQRAIAKRINFGIVYGISPYSLAVQFNMEVDQAEAIFERFRRTYPNVFKWMRANHTHLQSHGWVVTRFGRVRRLPEITVADERGVARMLRQAGNFPIQSAGADITNLACILVDKKLRKGKHKSMLVCQIHDSLITDVHPEEMEFVHDLVVNTMTVDVQEQVPWLQCTLEVDAVLYDRWGGATEEDLK